LKVGPEGEIKKGATTRTQKVLPKTIKRKVGKYGKKVGRADPHRGRRIAGQVKDVKESSIQR